MTTATAQTLMAEVLTGRSKAEPKVQSGIEQLCEALGYDVEREYAIAGAGRADLYLPTRRTVIETKGRGQAGPEKPGSRSKETQEQQCARYVQAESANDRWQVLLEPDEATSLPWQAVLTDGRRWWVWQWPVNHDGSLAGGRLTDEKIFVAGQDAEALAWLQSKTGRTTGKPWVPSEPRTVFENYLSELRIIYRQLRQEKSVQTKQHLWLDALKGSGCAPDEADAADLFLNHTLLITVARSVIVSLSGRCKRPEPIAVMSDGFASWPQARNEAGPTYQPGVDWTNRLFETTDAYDWRQRAQDVLRTLYQGLIPVEQRKAFGEYYTPDWLAAMLAERMIDDEWIKRAIKKYLFGGEPVRGTGILDPACGSGTFLFHAARRIFNSTPLRQADVTDTRKADFVARMVNGIDIHPIASEISRATLLRALPVAPSDGIDALHVYQGDALIYNRRNLSLSYNPNLPFYTITSDGGTEIRIPVAFAESPSFGQNISRFVNAAHAGQPMPAGVATGLSDSDATILTEAFAAITKVCREEGNSVWAWYIFNAVAPTTLARRKVDRILSNPPWVVLSDIRVAERREELETLSNELSIRVRRGKFDIAGLFVKRCRQNYLTDDDATAKAAWVLNRAALTASNWEKTRADQEQYNAEWLDFSKVKDAPFTGAASCAWIQESTDPNRSIIPVRILHNRGKGQKVLRNYDWREAGELVRWQMAPAQLPAKASEYLHDGATSPFRAGFKFEPYCLVNIAEYETNGDTTAIKTAVSRHEPWKSEGAQQGEIPTRWVRNIASRSAMLPYDMGLVKAVIPVTEQGQPDIERQSNAYWQMAEAIYQRHPTEGFDAYPTLWERINYQGKLLEQLEEVPDASQPVKVFYNASGQLLRAARALPQTIGEAGLYHATFGTAGEAAYLTAMLNAPCLQLAYQQSRKSDRDFHQHFWRTVPIPKYDRDNAVHQAIAQLCEEAETVAADARTLHGADLGQQKLSDRIRRELINRGIADQLDGLVRQIVPDQSEPAYPSGYHPWLSELAERHRRLLPQTDTGTATAHKVLQMELATYERMRAGLEAKYTDEWVVIHGDELAGIYTDFREAARDAGQRFGYGPFLIRQVVPTDWLEYAKELWRQRYANG